MTLHEVLGSRSAPPSSVASCWLERLVRGLIRHAAGNAPASLSERLEEEWFADLSARHGTIARLRFALGCCWATRVIAHELGAPARAAVTPATDKAAAVCTQVGPSFYSRRTTVSVLIVSLHTLVIYGLATGMARKVLEAVPDRLQVTLMPKPTPRYLPPPPQNTRIRQLLHLKPRPDPIVDVELPPVTVTDLFTQPRDLTPPPQPPPPQVIRVVGGPGAGFPNTADYYPVAARRLLEQGSAAIHVCVDGSGRLTADPTLAESSGSARLDQGALRLAKAGSGHYRATTEDGKPVSGCYAFRVRFELKD
jgi:periplasmic protein TonB